MNRLFVSLSFIAALLAFSSAEAHADTIYLRGDAWCPYNCEPGSPDEGYLIDISKEIFGKAGHTVDYKTLTWARTLESVRSGEFTGAIGAAKEDAPDLVFGSMLLGKSSNTFAVRAGDSFAYKDISSLDGHVLGATNGYAYMDDIDAYIEKNKADPKKVQLASGDDALSTNMNKLIAGRIDMFLEDGNVLANYIATKKLGDKVKVIQSPIEPLGVNIAFSPANPKSKEYVKLLDDGIKELRASGRLATILAKYGVKDWE